MPNYLNLVVIGNTTGAPELRYTQTGKAVATFTLAVNRRANEEAAFLRVTAWEALAEIVNEHVHKGDALLVSADWLTASAYTRQDNQPGASIDITARDIRFLTPRSAPDTPPENAGDIPF